MDIAFLVIGNEILQGFTTDTNSTFLGRRLTQLGHRVRRIVIVEDDVGAIGAELGNLLEMGMDMVLVCGGLGSTPDDVTVEAVAKALDLELESSEEVLNWLEGKVRMSHQDGRLPQDDLTDAHRKMSLVPAGSRVLFNEPGAAPGIYLEVGEDVTTSGKWGAGGPDRRILILPGVPREMKYIFKEQVEGEILGPTEFRPHVEELLVNMPESTMHDILEDFTREHTEVSIGSYPQDDKRVVLRVSGTRNTVGKVIDLFRRHIGETDYEILEHRKDI